MKRSYKLTQKQYEDIVDECDSVLQKYASDISIVGIAWLHVLNSHPANQIKYIHVFNPRTFGDSVKQFFYRGAVLLADLFLSLFSFFKKQDYQTVSENINLLFVSHLINPKAARTEPDFYFRELPDHMQSLNYKTAVALLNHTNEFSGWGEEQEEDKPAKILIPRRLGFAKEFRFLRMAVNTYFFFMKQCFSEKDNFKKSFLSELARNAFSTDTIRAFRIYETVRSILLNTDTRLLSLTWEGHSWERLVCYAAKQADHPITVIGYQHTILFPSSHAIKRSIGKIYQPDIILTVGSVTKKIMKDIGEIKVLEYGSPRLKEKNLYKGNDHIPNACLVAPEGLTEQSILLFAFGVEAARLMPETQFIFRMYPGIPFETVQSKDKRLQELPPNVIISSLKNMEDDFKRCSWLLYRSTSVSFFAVLAGLRPLYLQEENELSVDPLYMLASWRLNVEKPEQLISIIHKDIHAPAIEKEIEIKDAAVFCETYMTPYNMPLFEKIVKEEITNT